MLRDILHHAVLPYAIIIDIGSGSVGVAIIEVSAEQKKPLIIYTHRERIRVTSKKTEDEFIRALKEALLAATLELSSNGMKALHAHDHHARIETIHVLYASPWSEVVSRIIKVEKEEPLKATNALIETLVEEALKQARTDTHEDTIFTNAGLEVINTAIIDAKLNGYPVTDFLGQTCTSIELTHLSELAPKSVRDALRESEKHLLAHPIVTEHTFTATVTAVAKKIYPHTGSFIAIEVTGEATECAIVQHGVLYQNFYTLFGTHSFERALAKQLGTLEDEARAHITDYIFHTTRDDVTAAIQEVREIYKTELKRLLDIIRIHYVLPQDVVLTTEPNYKEFYMTLLEEVYSSYRNEYKFNILDYTLLAPFVQYTDEAVEDQYLALIAFFFHIQSINDTQRRAE